MRTSSPARYRESSASSASSTAVGYTSRSPKRMTTRSWSMSVSSWHLPTAIATRPQLGSAPCTAVLTSGELTIALATRLAWATIAAPSDDHLDQRLGALAVAGDLLVSDSATVPSAASSSAPSTGPGAPLASTTAVSLVDVSVSMLTQLNVRRRLAGTRVELRPASTRRRSAARRSSWPCRARSSRRPWRCRRPRRAVADRRLGDLGTVSVVMIPRRGLRRRRRRRDATAWQRRRRGCGRSGSAGRSRPSTRRARPGEQPSRRPRRRRSPRRPQRRPGPLATLAFLETTTIAWARRRRGARG